MGLECTDMEQVQILFTFVSIDKWLCLLWNCWRCCNQKTRFQSNCVDFLFPPGLMAGCYSFTLIRMEGIHHDKCPICPLLALPPFPEKSLEWTSPGIGSWWPALPAAWTWSRDRGGRPSLSKDSSRNPRWPRQTQALLRKIFQGLGEIYSLACDNNFIMTG